MILKYNPFHAAITLKKKANVPAPVPVVSACAKEVPRLIGPVDEPEDVDMAELYFAAL